MVCHIPFHQTTKKMFENALKTDILYLAKNYYSNYRPSLSTLEKHKILEKLSRNKDTVIIRPDKRNGVVVMDKVIYNQQMYALLSDKNKFKKLSEDPTKLREGQLQRYLRELKKKQFLDDVTYERIYPSGSQPSRLYVRLRFIKSNQILKFLHLGQ